VLFKLSRALLLPLSTAILIPPPSLPLARLPLIVVLVSVALAVPPEPE